MIRKIIFITSTNVTTLLIFLTQFVIGYNLFVFFKREDVAWFGLTLACIMMPGLLETIYWVNQLQRRTDLEEQEILEMDPIRDHFSGVNCVQVGETANNICLKIIIGGEIIVFMTMGTLKQPNLANQLIFLMCQ